MTTSTNGKNFRFIIIGAGMAGILGAIKLREAGIQNFAIYEKADRLGGTWRENEYPGLTCDVPSHLYSYSFAPNPNWSHRFSPGSEIQAYFEEVAHRYGVDELIQYGMEITRCEFEDGRWKIEMADGSTDEADFVIAATGVLHHPAYPVGKLDRKFAQHDALHTPMSKLSAIRIERAHEGVDPVHHDLPENLSARSRRVEVHRIEVA